MVSLTQEENVEKLYKLKTNLISKFYNFSYLDIKSLKSNLNFDPNYFVSNKNIVWSDELIELLKDKIDWRYLYKIENIIIDINFIEKYNHLIDFETLHYSSKIIWSHELFKSYFDLLNKNSIYNIISIFSSIKLIHDYESLIDWNIVSKSRKIEFSEEFIFEFRNLLNWKLLSANPKLPNNESFIKVFRKYIDFNLLSKNPEILGLIHKYPLSKLWDWELVILNPSILYNDENISFYLESFFNFLYENKKIKEEYPFQYILFFHKILSNQTTDRDYFIQDKYKKYINWNLFCKFCKTKISINKIESFKEFLNFKESAFINCHKDIITTDFIDSNLDLFDTSSFYFYKLPITKSIIKKCKIINWNFLSSSEKFDWDWEYIKLNINNLNLSKLSENKAVYDIINLKDSLDTIFDILPDFKLDDIVSFKTKGNRLYCIHKIIDDGINNIKIVLRNKSGEFFEINDFNNLYKHNNISSIEFDLDNDFESHLNRLYPKAYQNIVSFENEIWKEVPGFSNLFVSNLGRVFSKSGKLRPNFLKKYTNTNNHLFISRKKDSNNSNWQYQVCWLVALTFIPNPKNYKFLKHLNNNNLDNKVENLVWVQKGIVEKTPYQNFLMSREENFNIKPLDYDDITHISNNNDDWSLGWLDEETDGFWRWNID